jgi:hypothetical protein
MQLPGETRHIGSTEGRSTARLKAIALNLMKFCGNVDHTRVDQSKS